MTQVWDMWEGKIFQSSLINDWREVSSRKVAVILDLEGGLYNVLQPNCPDSILYIYYPIEDGPLPSMVKPWALTGLLVSLVREAKMRILVHSSNGANRASLFTALLLYFIFEDRDGKAVVDYVRSRRPGALTNQAFENFLLTLPKLGDLRQGTPGVPDLKKP